MKAEIHPDNYRLVAFKDMSNNDVFITKSTVNSKETLEPLTHFTRENLN
jgi:large subunit ribosomal protein L31